MKLIKYTVSILLLFIAILNLQFEAIATSEGFHTDSVSEEKKSTFLENINIVRIDDEPRRNSIDCFAVSEEGLAAIGSHGFFTNKTVAVYTSEGEFLHGFTFESHGDFGVDYIGDVLYICFVRSDIAIGLSTDGEIISVRKIPESTENYKYWDEILHSKERKCKDTVYTIENDIGFLNIFAFSYSRLVVTDSNGSQSIIYDVNNLQLVKYIVGFIAVIAALAYIAFIFWRTFKIGKIVKENRRQR